MASSLKSTQDVQSNMAHRGQQLVGFCIVRELQLDVVEPSRHRRSFWEVHKDILDGELVITNKGVIYKDTLSS